MLIYPHINPIAFSIGPFQAHWYGLMYLLGFLAAWCLGSLRIKQQPWRPLNAEQLGDLIFAAAMGVVLGGRIGYMLFYALPDFLQDPLLFFKVWKGGMSFHGGLLGVIFALWYCSRKFNQPFFVLSDFLAPLVPLGLGAGRIGNFINGELWGRVTTAPWGMIYPQAGPFPRHPSELYEFFMEGILLFTILWLFSRQKRPTMSVTGLFLLCYGLFRCIGESFRQPDSQLGFIAFNWLTMGQLLSLPMIIFGVLFLTLAYRKTYRERTRL